MNRYLVPLLIALALVGALVAGTRIEASTAAQPIILAHILDNGTEQPNRPKTWNFMEGAKYDNATGRLNLGLPNTPYIETPTDAGVEPTCTYARQQHGAMYLKAYLTNGDGGTEIEECMHKTTGWGWVVVKTSG